MSCLLAAFAYNIENVSLLFLVLSSHTVSIALLFLFAHSALWRNLANMLFCHPVLYLEQSSPMQTVVYCVPNLAGPHQMPHGLH